MTAFPPITKKFQKTKQLDKPYNNHDVAACKVGEEHDDIGQPRGDGVGETLDQRAERLNSTVPDPNLFYIWGERGQLVHREVRKSEPVS